MTPHSNALAVIALINTTAANKTAKADFILDAQAWAKSANVTSWGQAEQSAFLCCRWQALAIAAGLSVAQAQLAVTPMLQDAINAPFIVNASALAKAAGFRDDAKAVVAQDVATLNARLSAALNVAS